MIYLLIPAILFALLVVCFIRLRYWKETAIEWEEFSVKCLRAKNAALDELGEASKQLQGQLKTVRSEERAKNRKKIAAIVRRYDKEQSKRITGGESC